MFLVTEIGVYMRWAKNVLIFLMGAVGYALIEIIWRGFTHPTMMVAGGICFLAFSYIAEKMSRVPLLIKAFLAAAVVTAVELVFGLIFNLGFGMNVWNYEAMPFNFLGQICPTFSLIWCGIALIFVPLADRINIAFLRLEGAPTG